MERLTLNLVPAGVMPEAHASQFDNGRVIRFDIKNGDSAYTLTGAETITAEIAKPDGSREVISIPNTSSNYVDLTTEENTCSVPGLYGCEIKITDGAEIIGSQNFILKVEADPYADENVHVETVGPADICTFETTLPEPLQSVIVDIVATGGNGTPDNPNPINGYSSANITRCGVNLLHVNSRVSQTTAYVAYTSDDNYIYLNGTKSGGGYADMSALTVTLPKGTYYLKAFVISGTASNTVELYAYDGSTNLTGSLLSGEKTMTLTETTTFRFRFAIWADGTVCSNYKIGIVISTASISEYSEYTGNTYAIAFGQTVYGGVLDVTRGKLHVTWANLTFAELSTKGWNLSGSGVFYLYPIANAMPGILLPSVNNPLCSSFAYQPSGTMENNTFRISDALYIKTDEAATASDFKTWLANNTGSFAYELATPFDLDITPVQIEALVGVNNVWHDGNGDTEVKYLAEG